MKNSPLVRIIGFGAVCLGAGILISLILPRGALIFIEALIIVGVGGLYFTRK